MSTTTAKASCGHKQSKISCASKMYVHFFAHHFRPVNDDTQQTGCSDGGAFPHLGPSHLLFVSGPASVIVIGVSGDPCWFTSV